MKKMLFFNVRGSVQSLLFSFFFFFCFSLVINNYYQNSDKIPPHFSHRLDYMLYNAFNVVIIWIYIFLFLYVTVCMVSVLVLIPITKNWYDMALNWILTYVSCIWIRFICRSSWGFLGSFVFSSCYSGGQYFQVLFKVADKLTQID